MSRSLEKFECESVVTAAIAVMAESDNLDLTHIKNRIERLKLPGLLKMGHEHEVSDQLIEKCVKEVREFYG